MLGKLRSLGRGFQARYEAFISCRSLFGFSKLYAQAMREVKLREQKRRGV